MLSWWTRSGSLLKRSVSMDDFVHSVTPGEIRVDSVNRLGDDVAVVDLSPLSGEHQRKSRCYPQATTIFRGRLLHWPGLGKLAQIRCNSRRLWLLLGP